MHSAITRKRSLGGDVARRTAGKPRVGGRIRVRSTEKTKPEVKHYMQLLDLPTIDGVGELDGTTGTPETTQTEIPA